MAHDPLPFSGPGLTIGQVAEATGMTPQLLRTWETRHGFPRAVRSPSGHRRYDPQTVAMIKRVRADQAGGLRLDQAIERNAAPAAQLEVDSIFAELRARYPAATVSYRLRKSSLTRLSAAIEDECRTRGSGALVVSCFQTPAFYEQAAPRWSQLARTARVALAMAGFEAHDDDSVPARVALPPDSPILSEWILALESPTLSATLAAWEAPGQEGVRDADRCFEAWWTTDPQPTREALKLAAAAATGAGSGAGARLEEAIRRSPAPGALDPQATTAVLNRTMAYLEGA